MAPPRHHSVTARKQASTALAAATLLVLALAAAAPAAVRAARPWAPPPAKPASTTQPHHHHHARSPTAPAGKRFGSYLAAAGSDCNTTNPSIPASSDVVNVWYKACDESTNTHCRACGLYVKGEAARAAGNSSYYSGDSGVPRTKIIPTAPMAGIESIVDSGASTGQFWIKALADVANGMFPAFQTGHPVAYANSLDAREQHQLHIHVGPLPSKSAFYECAKSILLSPPASGKWAYKLPGKDCDSLQASRKYGVAMAATTASTAAGIDGAIRAGFVGSQVPGAATNKITSDPVLVRSGVLVQAMDKGGGYLVFLIYNTNDHLIFAN